MDVIEPDRSPLIEFLELGGIKIRLIVADWLDDDMVALVSWLPGEPVPQIVLVRNIGPGDIN